MFASIKTMQHQHNTDLTKKVWRTGRKVGRTIYAQLGDKPSDDDLLIGTLDTKELAKEAVRAHNVTLTNT